MKTETKFSKAYRVFNGKKYTLYRSGTKKIVTKYIEQYKIPKNTSYRIVKVNNEYRLYMLFPSGTSFQKKSKRKSLKQSQRLIIIGNGNKCDKSKCCNAEITRGYYFGAPLKCIECKKEIKYEDQILWNSQMPSYVKA